MALPGLFAGPRWRHHLYVDGGTVDTLPSDWAYALAPGPVLAVNVAQALPKPARLIGLADTLSRAEYLATSQLSALRELALPVFTLIPDTHGTPFFGFADYHRLVAAGYDAVMTHWPEIERFLLPHSEPG
jgi:predicted acylesterase/phospholipase RssA